MDACREIIQSIVEGRIRNQEELQRAKMEVCKEYGISKLLTNSEMLAACPKEMRERVLPLLRMKPTRTLSGVAVVAVMTKPHPCPHGKCLYCPGGIERGTPQSYTGREPATLRAIQNDFDPYLQTSARLRQLKAIGHSVDKLDLIIMGGTFTAFSRHYREWFIKRCLDALNGLESRDLREAQRINERAGSRCIGLTIETRPDCFNEDEASHSMQLGATRVELGVQTTNDRILHMVRRGHGAKESMKATKCAKDRGLKVCYHMMPGLPGSSKAEDIRIFREIFYSEEYMPDMLKIYPTLVIEGTGLYEMWKSGEYVPYSVEEMLTLLAEIKRMVPRWVRIQRIQRDIPAPLIVDGVRKGDIRVHARKILEEMGEKCNCIRCREVGRVGVTILPDISELVLERISYRASGGTELFLSYNNPTSDALVAYVRLRKCDGTARIRELKVLGEVVPIHSPSRKRWQHRGLGRSLVGECERIAFDEWGCDEIYVTSGVGARRYYARMGYHLEMPYMKKSL